MIKDIPSEKMKIIFLGPPGSGKGTYSSRVSTSKNWPHISTGDLLREEVKNSTELGNKAKTYMDEGKLVPDEVIIDMLKKRIEQEDCKEGFILDGFPRTLPQASALENITQIDVVINLYVPEHVIIGKILARRTCENCGDIYNIADIKFGPNNEYRMPPLGPKVEGICDKCGGKLISRSDETEDVIKNRLKVYSEQTEPLVKFYTDKGLVKQVDVIGPPEIMVPKILEILNGLKSE